jgi:Transposase and inactivated derivatives, IS5 family
MEQLTFAEAEYNAKKRKTRREKFLEQMDALIPWKQLERKIQQHYPKNGQGRQPYPLSVMLRAHCMQLFYNLSDPAMEDSLYEIESMRRFAGLSLSGPIPDETTILNFRHLLERHKLGETLFKEVNRYLGKQGLMLKEGSIVDATIIEAPTSTKNTDGERDPEMHQTKKGNEWHFGMKMHVGVDDTLGLIHSMTTTSANAHDITQISSLLHGKEKAVWGDAGYCGVEKRPDVKSKKVEWLISQRPGICKTLKGKAAQAEKIKAQIRAKVEHVFLKIKQQFGYSKVRYRGLAKNANRLHVLAAFTNLITCKKHLLT